jgi:hypothetical protein
MPIVCPNSRTTRNALCLALIAQLSLAGTAFCGAQVLDRDVNAQLYPLLGGAKIMSAGPLQATVIAHSSAGSMLSQIPANPSNVTTTLDTRGFLQARNISGRNGDALLLDIAPSFFLPPPAPTTFIRLSPRGELVRRFSLYAQSGTFATSSAGEFLISANTLKQIPENTTVPLPWCPATGCGFLPRAAEEATQGGAWLVQNSRCTLQRVGRDGQLLESFALPMPSRNSCYVSHFSRDRLNRIRMVLRDVALQEVALTLDDDGPIRIHSGIYLTNSLASIFPGPEGDFFSLERSERNTIIRRLQPSASLALSAPIILWETAIDPELRISQVLSAPNGGSIAYLGTNAIQLNPSGQIVQTLPPLVAAAFDQESNLVAAPNSGRARFEWYSPQGVLLRSDLQEPIQVSAISALGQYSRSGLLNVHYAFATGELLSDNVRQYSSDGVFSSSYSATSAFSTGSVNSDYWYGTQFPGGLFVRDLVRQVSTTLPLPCQECISGEIVDGLLLGGNAQLSLYQGTQVRSIPIPGLHNLMVTPLLPQGDIARLLVLSGYGYEVYGVNHSLKLNFRYRTQFHVELEPSGGAVGYDDQGVRVKFDLTGAQENNPSFCAPYFLGFTARGYWAYAYSGSKLRLCLESEGKVYSALIETNYPPSAPYGENKEKIVIGDSLYSLENSQLVKRALEGLPCSIGYPLRAICSKSAWEHLE